MKIVIIGGTGRIGSNVSACLRARGHEVIAAAPDTGVNTITGEGVAAALAGADVVVDVANSPSFADDAALDFFETSGRNLLAAAAKAGVGQHVALSIVGADRLPDSGYMRAKLAQESLIEASGLPYTILRSTQFFEFVAGIVASGIVGAAVHLSPALIQPIAADDVAAVLAEIAVAPPVNGIVEVAGPVAMPLADLAQQFLAASNDNRRVIADVRARYFGAELDDTSLTPGKHPHLGRTRFADWLTRQRATA